MVVVVDLMVEVLVVFIPTNGFSVVVVVVVVEVDVVVGVVVFKMARVLWSEDFLVVVVVDCVVVVSSGGKVNKVTAGGPRVECFPAHVFPSSCKVIFRGHTHEMERFPCLLANKHK